MISSGHLIGFTLASLVIIVTPGQDMILVMSRSIAQGSAAGVATAAGVLAVYMDERENPQITPG